MAIPIRIKTTVEGQPSDHTLINQTPRLGVLKSFSKASEKLNRKYNGHEKHRKENILPPVIVPTLLAIEDRRMKLHLDNTASLNSLPPTPTISAELSPNNAHISSSQSVDVNSIGSTLTPTTTALEFQRRIKQQAQQTYTTSLQSPPTELVKQNTRSTSTFTTLTSRLVNLVENLRSTTQELTTSVQQRLVKVQALLGTSSASPTTPTPQTSKASFNLPSANPVTQNVQPTVVPTALKSTPAGQVKKANITTNKINKQSPTNPVAHTVSHPNATAHTKEALADSIKNLSEPSQSVRESSTSQPAVQPTTNLKQITPAIAEAELVQQPKIKLQKQEADTSESTLLASASIGNPSAIKQAPLTINQPNLPSANAHHKAQKQTDTPALRDSKVETPAETRFHFNAWGDNKSVRISGSVETGYHLSPSDNQVQQILAAHHEKTHDVASGKLPWEIDAVGTSTDEENQSRQHKHQDEANE